MNTVTIMVAATSDLPIGEGAKAVVGERWLHTVSVDGELVKVAVRRSGLGYSMDIEHASSAEVAAAAMAEVAKNPEAK